MLAIDQSVARVVMLKLFDTGTTTASTGKTVAVTISKNGGAFANPSAGPTNATELSNGWYSVTLSTTDTNTVGDLIVRGTASGSDASERVFSVVPALPGAVLSAIQAWEVETGVTFTAFLRGMASALVGNVIDNGATYRGFGIASTRLSVSADSNGNRTVTYSG